MKSIGMALERVRAHLACEEPQAEPQWPEIITVLLGLAVLVVVIVVRLTSGGE